MKIGILACDILKPEIDYLTKDDPDFTKVEYLEFALHENPENMRNVIMEKAKEFVGEVDALFLGYAVCSSLEGIDKKMPLPTVMLNGSDCIEALLGSKEYAAEKKICPGTWFCTPGWALEGKNGIIKEMHLDSMEGYPPEFFMEILFASYERTLFIDTGIGNEDEYRQKSEEFAKELQLRHDCRSCGLERIEECIKEVKKLAAGQ